MSSRVSGMAAWKAASRIALERIQAAPSLIAPVFLNTPQYRSEALDDELGVRLVLKVETTNPLRSFKGRGSEVLLAGHTGTAPVVCASAGNFGQAVAWSSRKRGIAATIFAAENANPLKVERMRALGADVRLAGRDFDAAKDAARDFARQRGGRFVEDSFDVETVEGAGTIALELNRWEEPFDGVLIALGNGALANGIMTVLRAVRPATHNWVVQAEGAPAMVESWRENRRVVTENATTIADGIAVRVPVQEALDDMQGLVDGALLVSEESIVDAMRLLHRHAGLVVEPSGAVGVAALLSNRQQFAGQTLATVICGGNLTAQQMRTWLWS